MRRVAACLALLTGCASFGGSFAHPNYRVLAPHPDNPFDHSHAYTQPALAWDVEYAMLALGMRVAVAKLTPLSPVASAVIPCVGLGAGPHLAQWMQHQSEPSAHWAFTLSDRCLPLAMQTGNIRPWLVSTLLLSGYDR